jgi:hypothetical protein
VKSIESIGELVCAEYYGEVVQSLKSIKQENSQLEFAGFYETTHKIVLEYYNSLDRGWNDNKKVRKTTNWFTENYSEFTSRMVFEQLIEFSGCTDADEFIKYELLVRDWQKFSKKYESKIARFKNKSVGKAEIVYIGRGWVKAGFDLKNYDYTQLDTTGDTLVFNNLDPEILDADINPWFVPEEVKGFEIIKIEKEKDIDLSEITLVKTRCKEQLLQQAFERNIYQMAIESGEETLEGFVTLLSLSGNRNYKKVIINPGKLFELKSRIIRDNVINDADIEELKRLFKTRNQKNSADFDVLLGDLYLSTLGNPNNSNTWRFVYDSLKANTK